MSAVAVAPLCHSEIVRRPFEIEVASALAMSTQGPSGKKTARRYSTEEKDQAVRLGLELRAETGQKHGAVKRVAEQLGYGVESVRGWVRQHEIDNGERAGASTEETEEVKALRQEVRELRRANAILKSTSAFFASVSS